MSHVQQVQEAIAQLDRVFKLADVYKAMEPHTVNWKTNTPQASIRECIQELVGAKKLVRVEDGEYCKTPKFAKS